MCSLLLLRISHHLQRLRPSCWSPVVFHWCSIFTVLLCDTAKQTEQNEFISLFFSKKYLKRKNTDPAKCHGSCEAMCIRYFSLFPKRFSRNSFQIIFSYENFDVDTQMVHFLGEILSYFFFFLYSFEWNCLHVTKSALWTSKRRNALKRYINGTAFLRLSLFLLCWWY